MARIRTIKPEFFSSDDICALSPLARLLYVGLWCEADREGRLTWAPRVFKRRYLPDDPADIEALCGELVRRGLVRLYGEGLAFVPSFGRHQHVNPREAASKLPAPDRSTSDRPTPDRPTHDQPAPDQPASSRDADAPPDAPPDAVRDASHDVPPDAQVGREGKERESEGKEGKGFPERRARAFPLPEDWTPEPADLAWAKRTRSDLTPALLEGETERFRNHALANHRTAHDWSPNWRNWVMRAVLPAAAEGRPARRPWEKDRPDAAALPAAEPWGARLHGYRPGRWWDKGRWGPRPESGHCLAPPDLLAQWRAQVEAGTPAAVEDETEAASGAAAGAPPQGRTAQGRPA